MAISLRSLGQVQVWSTATSSTFTVPAPTGITAGDLLLACVTTSGDGINLPAGWTSLYNLTTANNPQQRVMYKIADSTDAAASSFAFTLSAASYGSAEVLAYTGVDTTTPIDFTTTPVDTATTQTAFTVTGTTVVTAGAVLVGGASGNTGVSSSNWTLPSNPGAWTAEWDPFTGAGGAQALSGGKSHILGSYMTPLTAGASTGDMTFTLSVARAGSAWVAGLRPASTAAPEGTASGNYNFTGTAQGPVTGITRGTETSVESASATSITVNHPAGAVTNDLLLFTVVSSDDTTVTAPAGLTPVGRAGDSAGNSTWVWYRFVDGTEGPDYTFTGTVGRVSAVCIPFTGVDTTKPFDVAYTSESNATSSTSLAVPELVTLTNNTHLVSTGVVDAATAADLTVPTGMTDTWHSTGTGRRLVIAEENFGVAGATGTRTWTKTSAIACHSILLALRKAGLAGPAGTVTNVWVGAPTTDGATVVAQLEGDANSARLQVSTSSDLSSPVFSSAVPVSTWGVARLPITGLSAGTLYYFGVEVDGTLDTVTQGQFKTAPSGAASFKLALASCMSSKLDGDSDSPSWSRALAHSPDLCLVMGDLAYMNEKTNSPYPFRANMDAQLTFPNMSQMFATVPVVYAWSDHDFGENDADASAPSKPAAQEVYREKVPHYPLEVSDGIYHTFVYGRVRFIVTDERSFASPLTAPDDASKTVLGTTQKQWFKDTLAAATEPLIFWMGDAEWIGSFQTGYDGFLGATTERDELAAYIQASGKRVVRAAGDIHCLAADDGTNSPGGVPVIQAAPWSRGYGSPAATTSYSGGFYPTTNPGGMIQQYGLVEITDTGSGPISLTFTGYDSTNTARVTMTTSVSTSQGSAGGTYVYAGSAAGGTALEGSASGAYTFTGTAVGETTHNGTASGTFLFAGTAFGSVPGVTPVYGSASGTFTFTGSATGEIRVEGTAAGGFTFSGSAAGQLGGGGRALGGFAFTGLAVGQRDAHGIAVGSFSFVATAAGEPTQHVYLFSPPSFEEGIRTNAKPLSYYRITVSSSVVRINGVLTTVRTPAVELLSGEEGTDWFIGGHVYNVSPTVREELLAAGYEVTG